MTLREVIKKNKLKDYDYISMYNNKGSRFYGTMVNNPSIEEYLDMEITDFHKFSDTSSVYIAKFLDYKEKIGLDSLRLFESKNQKQKDASERSSAFDLISKKTRRTKKK